MKSLFGDLHVHSCFSDGNYLPIQLIEKAVSKGLDFISITDHDTVDGVIEAKKRDTYRSFRLIEGIELTVSFNPKIHILGYNINIEDIFLNDYLRLNKLMSIRDFMKFIKLLRKKYEINEFEKYSKIIPFSFSNLIKSLVIDGVISDEHDYYIREISGVNYNGAISEYYPSLTNGVNVIRNSGGIPVLAHPGQLSYKNNDLLELVTYLKKIGLRGIECYHPSHTKLQCESYLKIAKEYDLFITGGSDYHDDIDVSIDYGMFYNDSILDFEKEAMRLKVIY